MPNVLLQGHGGYTVLLKNHLNEFIRLAGIGSEKAIWALASEATFIGSPATNGGTAEPTYAHILRRSIKSPRRLLNISDIDTGDG